MSEFAVVISMIATAAIVVQHFIRRSSVDSMHNVATVILGDPVVAPVGRPLPRTGCLDTTGDGNCDCMDSDRDGACDGFTANSNSQSVETGPSAGRTTVITETSTGNAAGMSVQYTVVPPSTPPTTPGTGPVTPPPVQPPPQPPHQPEQPDMMP